MIKLPLKASVAAIDVDSQQCFTPEFPDELPVNEGDKIVDELNSQATFAQLRIASKDAHSAVSLFNTSDKQKQFTKIVAPNMDTYWPPHAIIGTKGFKLLEGLPAITEYDFFIWKGIEIDMHPYGACYHDLAETLTTGLIEYLHIHHITTVIIGGLALDICVKSTAQQLVKAGFSVIINKGATRAVSVQGEQETIALLEELGVRFVNSSREFKQDKH